MSNAWDGTFMYIWQPSETCGGLSTTMIATAKTLGITGVIIKFANGSLVGDPNSQSYMNSFKKLIGPFKQAGFKVGGWIYQYLTDVAGEVDACSQAIQAGVDFIVLDGEVELKGKNAQVTQFGKQFRSKYPTFPLGLSSFAIPDYHQEVPFDEYNAFVNFMSPQIYWGEMQWSISKAFSDSVQGYSKYGKPIAPTGQTYGVSTVDMSLFSGLCKTNEFTHLSWWDWQESPAEALQAIKGNILQPPAPPKPQDTPAWEKSAHDFVVNSGISDGTRPHDPVLRVEVWAMLERLYEKLGGK